MSDKIHHFMFCYSWSANSQSGNGYRVLANEVKEITITDIDVAIDLIKDSVSSQWHHSKEAIQIIFTNIIHLNHCTHDEFWDRDK